MPSGRYAADRRPPGMPRAHRGDRGGGLSRARGLGSSTAVYGPSGARPCPGRMTRRRGPRPRSCPRRIGDRGARCPVPGARRRGRASTTRRRVRSSRGTSTLRPASSSNRADDDCACSLAGPRRPAPGRWRCPGRGVASPGSASQCSLDPPVGDEPDDRDDRVHRERHQGCHHRDQDGRPVDCDGRETLAVGATGNADGRGLSRSTRRRVRTRTVYAQAAAMSTQP